MSTATNLLSDPPRGAKMKLSAFLFRADRIERYLRCAPAPGFRRFLERRREPRTRPCARGFDRKIQHCGNSLARSRARAHQQRCTVRPAAAAVADSSVVLAASADLCCAYCQTRFTIRS
jgi:hypothetical protein